MPLPSSSLTFETDIPLTMTPTVVRIKQQMYAHDLFVAVIDYIDPVKRFDEGTPVSASWGYGLQGRQNFYGYVHHTEPYVEPHDGARYLQRIKVVCVGASQVFKAPVQQSWQNRLASSIVREILGQYMFSGHIQDTTEVLSSFTWNGDTAWSLMSTLARNLGWTFYAAKTDVIFKDPLVGLKDMLDTAALFSTTPQAVTPGQQQIEDRNNNIFTFSTIDGELSGSGGIKATRILNGLDPRTLNQYTLTNDTSAFVPNQLGYISSVPMFQRYVTSAGSDIDTALSTLNSVQSQNRWSIQATAEVVGRARVRPGSLVFMQGVPKRERGYWYVEGTDHQIKENRYRLVLTLGRDARFSEVQTIQPSVRRVVRQRFDPFGNQKGQTPGSLLVNKIWRAEYAAQLAVPGAA